MRRSEQTARRTNALTYHLHRRKSTYAKWKPGIPKSECRGFHLPTLALGREVLKPGRVKYSRGLLSAPSLFRRCDVGVEAEAVLRIVFRLHLLQAGIMLVAEGALRALLAGIL